MSIGRPGGTITIADKEVSRLGLGTLRLAGPGCWGPALKPREVIQVLRYAVEVHGISHIDTADAYGPYGVESLIHRTLRPYRPEVLIATKVGLIRPAPDLWRPLGRPDYLRAAVESSLRRLGLECLELCYLHRVDPAVPMADQVGELAAMRDEGKIGHIGLSKVTPAQIAEARRIVPVSAVQNVLNIDEPNDPALEYCRQHKIPYVPYRPLNVGTIRPAKALRWLLDLAPNTAPIPGTSSSAHLRELVDATN